MFSALSLLASLTILFFILRFRVHVHMTYTPTDSRYLRGAKKGRRAERAVGADTSTARTRPEKFNEFVPAASKKPERSSGPIACQPPATRAARVSDIASGLINLGCCKRIARNVASKVVSEYPDATIETQLSVALQEVRGAA